MRARDVGQIVGCWILAGVAAGVLATRPDLGSWLWFVAIVVASFASWRIIDVAYEAGRRSVRADIAARLADAKADLAAQQERVDQLRTALDDNVAQLRRIIRPDPGA